VGELLTAQEAASELAYHIHHLYRLLRSGSIEARQFNPVWMINRQEVERVKAVLAEYSHSFEYRASCSL